MPCWNGSASCSAGWNPCCSGYQKLTLKIESEYYVDEDVRIAPALAEPPKDLTRRQRLRQWKKARRQFRQMPDGPEKFRFGYGLALEGAKLRELQSLLEKLEKLMPQSAEKQSYI